MYGTHEPSPLKSWQLSLHSYDLISIKNPAKDHWGEGVAIVFLFSLFLLPIVFLKTTKIEDDR